MNGRLTCWLVGVRLGHYRAVRTCKKKKKKGKTLLPFQSRVCAPRRAEAAWHLGSCSFCAAPWKWPPPFVPAVRPLRPWANIQVKQWQTLSRFRRREMGRGPGGEFKIWLLSFFFPFVCLSLIDCGVLGLRPQRSGVKDVRCRVNEATLIRFWPPSALTSSSRTPVPWRGDTFDLRLVCRRHVALLLFCFFTSELDTSRDL